MAGRGRTAIILGFCAWALLAACAVAPVRASAAEVIVDRLDAAAEVDPTRVVSGAMDAKFAMQPYAALVPSREHGVWYRIRLAANWSEPKPPVLAIFDPSGLHTTLYAPPGYTARPESIYDREPDAGYTRHAIVYVLPQTLDAATPLYLHIDAERAIPRRIEVASISAYRVEDLNRARLDAFFPAFQLATLLVMLAFFLVLRDRMYAYFVGYALFLVLYELYAFGVGYDLPVLRWMSPFETRALWTTSLWAASLNVAFSRRFLELARWAPRLDRVLRASIYVFFALGAAALVPVVSRGWWIEDALSLLLLVSIPVLITAAVLAWQLGGRRGGLFLCAWIPALLLTVLRVLQLRMQWPLPMWLEFGLPAALAYANLVLAFVLAEQTLSIRYERDVANRLAEHDPLTGVLNRRAILARLRAEFVKARQSDEPLSLLFLDLDHFKRVNDTFGHRAGDQCLRGVIAPIAGELRQGDALGRYGGEEFLVVLPGAGGKDARTVAERIRRRVQELAVVVSGTTIDLTLSVGVATLESGIDTLDELIEQADTALYRSKSGGRNLVSAHADAFAPDAPG